MDIIVVASICLQFLLSNVPRIGAIQFRCMGYMCNLADMTSAGEFFLLRFGTKKTYFITVENVQMKQLDTASLSPAPEATRSITVQKSDALSAVTISAAPTRFSLHFRWTSIREVEFARHCPLQRLSISYSKLVAVPATIYRATALTTLGLSYSAIRTVDMALFCNCSLLKRVDFTANKIRTVVNSYPRPCKVYDSLEEWNLSHNLLKTVSMTLFKPFVMLRVLELKDNLIRLFAGCYTSDMLQQLDISSNKLKTFSLCQWRIPFLSRLSLDGNQLSMVPSCLDNLKTLTHLSMDDNRLTEIDFIDMAWMDNLQQLSLSGNGIRSLTLNSSDFPIKLRQLKIDKNNMTELRLLLVPGVALEVNAQDNQIGRFDINATSPKISELNMWGNPMDCSWTNPTERMNSHCYGNT